jgi:carbon monoxide dehydrogenase subunit G
MRSRQRAAAGLVFVAVALVAAAVHAQTGFSAAERATLESGGVVRRPSDEYRDGHHFVGGASYAVIPRPVAEVWRALQDVPSFSSMLPSTRSSRVVLENDRETIARIEHAYGPVSATYYLRMTFDTARHHLEFDLDASRPHDIDAAHGFCDLTSWPGDSSRTVVTWAGRADPGSSILFEPFRSQIADVILDVPRAMRDYLAGSGRDRYRD